jgi:1-acyl-sn-glycerol-3-phosphate acyltransferase
MNINNYNKIDYNKNLNCMCHCGYSLPFKNDEIIMLYPCEHLMHLKCYQKLNNNICPYCNEGITKIIRGTDEDIHYQRYADILSMSYYHNLSFNTMENFVDSFFDMISVFVKIPFLKNKSDGKELCKKLFALNNLNLKVTGMEKLKLAKNKVLICNHVSYFEFIIIYYLFGCGFLASSIVGKSKLVDQFKKIVPLLTFNRGDKNNKNNSVVDQMRDFVDEKGSICLFPEGLMHHPDTLTRFRTGCFHINRPLYTVTIKHNDLIMDETINGFLFRLGSKKQMNIEVIIQGPYLPPFNQTDMDNVRFDMAKKGNMLLSRVTNRDIKDKNRDVKL